MANKIVINASAAKYGGAKTIVDSFVNWIGEHDCVTEFLLLAPSAPEFLPANVKFVAKQSSGLGTLLFSCVGILFHCLRFRASHCISFNNVNLILPLCRRITYFHQAKVFSERSLRFRLIALAIHLLRGSSIVLQSPLIETRFVNKFGTGYRMLVKWPGVVPEKVAAPAENALQAKTLLWPVTDPSVSQKNLPWLVAHQGDLEAMGFSLSVTAKHASGLNPVRALGSLSRAQLFALYQQVDSVLIVSSEETLCLPIFEAASVGARVLVLRMPYIEAIEQWRGLPENVQLFADIGQLQALLHSPVSPCKIDHNYFKPDWQIY